MDAWSRGRVGLIGDAAFCVSLLPAEAWHNDDRRVRIGKGPKNHGLRNVPTTSLALAPS